MIKGQWLREVAYIVVGGSTRSGCGRMNYPKFGWAGIQRGTFLFCATLKQRKCLFVIRRIVRFEQILNFLIAFLGDTHLTKSRYVESHRAPNATSRCRKCLRKRAAASHKCEFNGIGGLRTYFGIVPVSLVRHFSLCKAASASPGAGAVSLAEWAIIP